MCVVFVGTVCKLCVITKVQNVGIECGVVVIWEFMRILCETDDGLKGELSHN